MTKEPRDSESHDSRWWRPKAAIAALVAAVLVVVIILIVSPHSFDLGDNSSSATASADYRRTFAQVSAAGDLTLQGYPAVARLSVPVPIDAGPSNLALHLEGESSLAVGGEFTLTVYANGRPIKQLALPTGDSKILTTVRVPESVEVTGPVKFMFKVDGIPAQPHCASDDRGIGSLVMLRATSSFTADLADPIRTVRDRVAALTRDVTIYAPAGVATGADGSRWYATAQNLGIAMTQAGYQVAFAALPTKSAHVSADSSVLVGPTAALAKVGWKSPTDGPSKASSMLVGKLGGQATLAIIRPTALAGSYVMSNGLAAGDSSGAWVDDLSLSQPAPTTVGIGTLGVNTQPLQIGDSYTWSMHYSVADMPSGHVPTEFHADFSTPEGLQGWRWQVSIALNNDLLYDGPLRGGVHRGITVALPVNSQALRNALTVTLQRDRSTGGCDQRTTAYTVQLGPGSGFGIGSSGDANELVNGVSRLREVGGVVVEPAAASAMIAALTATVPTLAAALPVGATPSVSIAHAAPTRGISVLVSTGEATETALALHEDLPAPNAAVIGHLVSVGGLQNALVTAAVVGVGRYTLVLAFRGNAANQGVINWGHEQARLSTVNGPSFVVDQTGHIVRSPIVHADAAN